MFFSSSSIPWISMIRSELMRDMEPLRTLSSLFCLSLSPLDIWNAFELVIFESVCESLMAELSWLRME